MLSRDSRYFIVVAASVIVGVTIAWVPLTSAPLAFRETSIYPVWVFLEAIIAAACPIVWISGKKALDRTPQSRPLLKEVIWYGICAVVSITFFLAAAVAFFRHASPVSLPYSKVRFGIIYLASSISAAPACIAMYRVGVACQNGAGSLQDITIWRTILQSQLTRLGTLVVLATLTTGAFRKAVLAVNTAHPSDFPAEYVLVFGAGLTVLLAIVYIPPSQRLRQRAHAMVDEKFPVPEDLNGDWQQQMQRRYDLTVLLKLDETNRDLIQNVLTIGGPLIATIISILIPVQLGNQQVLKAALRMALPLESAS
jgi:hypothetical protein